MDTIERVKQSLNPNLKMRGVVLTMYDRRTYLSRQVGEKIRTEFNGKVFNIVIPMNVRLAESPSYHKPIVEYAPASTWKPFGQGDGEGSLLKPLTTTHGRPCGPGGISAQTGSLFGFQIPSLLVLGANS